MSAGVERAERIARLNDLARQAMGIACRALATSGFRTLPQRDQSRVRELIETFDAFDAFGEGNDPYGERDFGAVYQANNGSWTTTRPERVCETVFWNIDAYDRALEWGSPDAADPRVTRRVLTIMLASEY